MAEVPRVGPTLEALARENDSLQRELLALRRFIDSMQNFSEAVDLPRTDDQLLDLMEDVLENSRRAINAKDGSLLVLDENTHELVFVLTQGDIPHDKLAWRRIPPGQGIAGWVIAQRRATIVHDARGDDRFWDSIDEEFQFKTDSVLAAPIIGGGRILGVVEVLNKLDGLRFDAEDQSLLGLMCRFAGEALYNMAQRTAVQ